MATSTAPKVLDESDVQYEVCNNAEESMEDVNSCNQSEYFDYRGINIVRRRGHLPKLATAIMKQWLQEHCLNPYPTELEKENIAKQTNLTVLQVSNWMINARRRIVPDMVHQKGCDPNKFLIKRRRPCMPDPGQHSKTSKQYKIGGIRNTSKGLGRPVYVQSASGHSVVMAAPYTGPQLLVVIAASGNYAILRLTEEDGNNGPAKAHVLNKAKVVQLIGDEAIVKLEAPLSSYFSDDTNDDEAHCHKSHTGDEESVEEEILYYDDGDSVDTTMDDSTVAGFDGETTQVEHKLLGHGIPVKNEFGEVEYLHEDVLGSNANDIISDGDNRNTETTIDQ